MRTIEPKFLDELTMAYHRGRLVPFIGAGMSIDVCPGWDDFVAALERDADLPGRPQMDPTSRAARAVRRMRLDPNKSLVHGVRSALTTKPAPPPGQTLALAAVHWPLVLTTNYDDLYMAAAHKAILASGRRREAEIEKQVPIELLGRSRADCQRVLTSLRQPDAPIVWALQGYIGGIAASFSRPGAQGGPRWNEAATYQEKNVTDHSYDKKREELEHQLVVGHAEYRRVALSDEHFRRTFAEVFRSRSLLFVGTALHDKYFLDLFGEVIELYGPSPWPHYAVMREGEADEDFLHHYFGIRLDEIHAYEELPTWIGALAEATSAVRLRQSKWHLSPASPTAGESQPELRVVRGKLPSRLRRNDWAIFSAGGSKGRAQISSAGKKILKRLNLSPSEKAFDRSEPSRGLILFRHQQDQRFCAINARLDPWTLDGARFRPKDPTEYPLAREKKKTAGGAVRRDLRLIAPAVEVVMEAAAAEGARHVHSMLLASGEGRTFPQSYAFRQMLRGWALWQSRASGALPGLSIYVIAKDVLQDLDSGRLDLASCLRAHRLDFWLEFHLSNGSVDRHLCTEEAHLPLLALLQRFDAADPGWRLTLLPVPCLGWDNWNVGAVQDWEEKIGETMTLDRFGVFPGTTLILNR